HLRIFQHPRVRSSTVCYHSFNLLKSRSPPLRVYCPRLNAHFVLAFASPPVQKTLGLPRTITRRLIMQKASGHRLHSTAVEWSAIKSKITIMIKSASFALLILILFLILISHSAGGRMEPAPTHCMQTVSGTISLP